MAVEVLIIALSAKFDGRMIWLIGLDDDVGVLVATVGTSNNLGEELESALFGREIGEGEAGVGLNDT